MLKPEMHYADELDGGYTKFISVGLSTECGYRSDNQNMTIVEITGFEQPVIAENISDGEGYGFRIKIMGDWEAYNFMKAIRDTRRLYKLARRENKAIANGHKVIGAPRKEVTDNE